MFKWILNARFPSYAYGVKIIKVVAISRIEKMHGPINDDRTWRSRYNE